MSMQALKELTLASLAEIDGGRFAAAFQQHIKRVSADCFERPTDSKAREITIKLSVKPIEIDGLCDDVNVTMQVASTVPKQQTRPYNMALKKAGLLYRPDSPDDVEQNSFLED